MVKGPSITRDFFSAFHVSAQTVLALSAESSVLKSVIDKIGKEFAGELKLFFCCQNNC